MWHTLGLDDVMARLATSATGLSQAEAARRLQVHGPNELARLQRTEWWETLVAQFKNVLVLILLAATAASAATGRVLEALVIAIIVLFAVVLGFIQEYRAGRALDALRRLAAPNAHVIRDGQEHTVPSREVVPGDCIRLHDGDRVPADARIVTAINLAVDESTLTGESAAVRKTTAPLSDAALPVGDRTNMAFSGTLVVHGRGTAVVVGTGQQTEFGAISQLVQSVRSGPTPLQQNLDTVGRVLGQAAALIVITIVAAGVWRGAALLDMFMFGIALAVAVVPEALPAVVTISLAIGVRRMVKRAALIRRLSTVEALGTISVICSDKTGTLTKNEMTVRRVYGGRRMVALGGAGYDPVGDLLDEQGQQTAATSTLRDALMAAVLCSDAQLRCREGHWAVEGDPTEGALLVAAAKVGIDRAEVDQQQPRIDELPFSAERRRMTTLHLVKDARVAYSKGAADVVIASCTMQRRDDGDVPLDAAARDHLFDIERQLASQGLRVLAVAVKDDAVIATAENAMTFLALVGMMDPPRPEARAAVATCKRAGITPVLITGDHPLTALTIARELDMLSGRVVTGTELNAMSDEDLARDVEAIGVYARVSPADKLRVVTAWQQRGAVVGMTGDGVNDAPALKKADVGIAMGITGTDVSKEAAGMTLLDDNFATILAAVEEGRVVFANVRKYLGYLLSSNVGEIILMAAASLVGAPLPLTPVQILYVNLATDGLPALALAVDPPDGDVMDRPPRDPKRGVLTRSLTTLIVIGGLWAGLSNVWLFVTLLDDGRPVTEAMTFVFLSLVLMEFFKAFVYRSLDRSMFHALFSNRWLNAAIAWELLLLTALVYFPPFQSAFGTFGLTVSEWMLVIAVAVTIVPVLETVKWIQRRERAADHGHP